MIGRYWLFRLSISVNAIVLAYLTLHCAKKSVNVDTSVSSAINPLINNKNYKISISVQSFDETEHRAKPSIDDLRPPASVESSSTSIPPRRKLFPCDDLTLRTHYGQRGQFWVLFNYFKASRQFHCDESLTYTTHADFTFLDNLIPLLEEWQGPISIAIYAPGTDFEKSVNRINYLRHCLPGSSKVTKLVTFHLFFDFKHVPKFKIHGDPSQNPVNCNETIQFGEKLSRYRKTKKSTYPVNVARNIAREMATTMYILLSDIELYPSPNLISEFLAMLKQKSIPSTSKTLFVISIFEVDKEIEVLPKNKTELVRMLQNRTAIPFHRDICLFCHRIPNETEWQNAQVTSSLNVFLVGKRLKKFSNWEPIYIGTKFDPIYDERLIWEGRSDKMTQAYALCLLDYEFHVLDNAFLVHRPGIKKIETHSGNNSVVQNQNRLILDIVQPQLKQLYGFRDGCI